MDQNKIYIKGMPGFKSAVLSKLGGAWLLGTSDIGNDVVSFTLPENDQLNDFKTAIGKDLISEHKLEFFLDLDEHLASQAIKKPSTHSVRMSIWTNSDSKITGKKAVAQTEEVD
jgi:hypothetical protein